jgi:RimK family alpha-L-glutamate ligase
MFIGVITKNERSWCSSKIIEAFHKRGIKTLAFSLPQIVARVGFKPSLQVKGTSITDFAGILVRPIGPGSLDEIIFRIDLLHRASRLGVPITNSPLAIERAADKYFTLTLLEDSGIAVPRTVATESVKEAVDVLTKLGDEVVMKPIFGSQGRGITKVSDVEVAGRILRLLNYKHFVLYLQEYIKHGDRDIRCLVIGDRVAAAMYRVSEGWKTNVSQGGRPMPFKPEEAVEKTALGAAKAVGCEIAGVDIMECEGGLVVHEVNSQPGFMGLQTSSGVDIAGEIADYIIGKARK